MGNCLEAVQWTTRLRYRVLIDDHEYGQRAGTIALLSKIQDHIAFDLILFDLLDGANEKNQSEIVIDSSLAQQLQGRMGKVLPKSE